MKAFFQTDGNCWNSQKMSICKITQIEQLMHFIFMFSFSHSPISSWIMGRRKVCPAFPVSSNITSMNRSSHRRYLVKKGVLKIFANFTEKQLCWILFLIKLRKPYLFWRTPTSGCFWINYKLNHQTV